MLIKNIQSKIFEIRGHKVMLDFDLAAMYEVETRILNQAVKRNIDRFPSDFMFQLLQKEYDSLRSQIVTLEIGRGKHSKYLPYAFTEQGVSMLSSVLKSKKAIQVNISIMRVFVAVKQMVLDHSVISQQLEALEAKFNKQFKDVYEALNYLMEIKKVEQKQTGRTKIGFKK